MPYATAYVASKFAGRGFSESLRQGLGADDIAVCTVLSSPCTTSPAPVRARHAAARPAGALPPASGRPIAGKRSRAGAGLDRRERRSEGGRRVAGRSGTRPFGRRRARLTAVPDAVIFDLDGVLMDSEQRWNAAKEALVHETGGRWLQEAPTVMMGMSSLEWSAYVRDTLGVPMDLDAISRDVVRRMEEGYREGLPLLPGAGDAVRSLAGRWPLGLASSSN